MTTWDKSKSLWLMGAFAGAVIGGSAGHSAKHTFGGALMGAIIVGGIGDAMIERDDRDRGRRLR